MRKIFWAALLIFLIYGCGVATKDTSSATAAQEQSLWVFSDKGLSEGRISSWTRSVGQSKQTFQGAPQDALRNGQGLFLATSAGLYVSTDNAYTYALLITGNVTSLATDQSGIWAATDRGCFASTANLEFEAITSPNSYQKIVCAAERLYILGGGVLQASTANGWAVAAYVSGDVRDFGFVENNLFLLTDAGLTTGSAFIEAPISAPYKLHIFGRQLWLAGDKALAKSTDSGATWAVYDTNVNYNAEKVRDILSGGLNIYVAAENGLWYSLNGGESWKVLRKQNGLLSNNTVKTLLR
ncbi:MAG: hypothetical protein LBD99_00695 [Candidatus Margulisbacteria bacterium]|jgi:hypothetical protein|nr:hypothetical protein [Candidatus Margulisiibacteriota bacterium]